MTKNKLEKLFSESMHADKEIWGMKLISNPLSHHSTPADYILETEKYLMLIECKMITLKKNRPGLDMTGRLVFKRLKQIHDLVNFENVRPDKHLSFFCVAYYTGRWETSSIFMIPVHTMERIIMMCENQNVHSLNRTIAESELKNYKMTMKDGLIDLSFFCVAKNS